MNINFLTVVCSISIIMMALPVSSNQKKATCTYTLVEEPTEGEDMHFCIMNTKQYCKVMESLMGVKNLEILNHTSCKRLGFKKGKKSVWGKLWEYEE